ncbi:MbtH family protein [Catellatospora tritici]|uniref:MbtH family protein n=1 Tax=Catellatospora tritici TaxID=2851566 RepID=UPI001C2DB78E|nr:MbtH family NRPS accessory protein [Catellatospora tritici]MBV1855868.1 MbtH family NRPS accessory protein [Catellatospora tritici]
MEQQRGDDVHVVVINSEEQYSIWPLGRELPAGWRQTGKQGSKDACRAHIDEVWTDMRPLTLRQEMAGKTGR